MTAPLFQHARSSVTEAIDFRGSLEQGVIERLRPLEIQHGGYLEMLGHYERLASGGGSEDDLFSRLNGRAPAVLIQTGGASRAEGPKGRGWITMSIDLVIHFVSNHVRSHEARLLGDQVSADPSKDPGIYRMLADVRALTHHFRAVGCSKEIVWNGEIAIERGDNNLSRWAQTYSAEFRVDAYEPLDKEREQITSIEVDHKLSIVGADC